MTTTPSRSAVRPWLLILCALSVSACAASRARAREANVARVRLAIANDRAQHRDWQAALSALEPLPKDGDSRAAALTLRGTIFREKGMLEEAEADLKDAVGLRSDVAATHAALGMVYDLRNDFAGGATHHERAVELEPENARYLNDLAFSLFLRGKPKEAISVYQRALRSAPEDRRIRNNLGFALARTGEFSRAAQQFALGGTPAQAKNNLGYAYEQSGNLAQAFDRYLEATRLDPTLRQAHDNLRHVAEALNRKIPPDTAGAGGQS
jgi:Flp pilus assembly protein TadD